MQTNVTIETILSHATLYAPKDGALIRRAYDFSAQAHEGQLRKSGEPYITHPLAVAFKLAEMRLSPHVVAAGLLHDVTEDTPRTIQQIEAEFGTDIARLVNRATKLGNLKYRGKERYAENLRNTFVAMAEDVRVVFLKFTDRIHNLETLAALPPEKQRRIALEAIEIYARIADRLGIGKLKEELEDLAFPFAYPEAYASFRETTDMIRTDLASLLEEYKHKLHCILSSSSLSYLRLEGRVKRQYSLYRKLQEPKYEQNPLLISDLIAVRIITKTTEDCYQTLGLVHTHFRPAPEKFKDYIATPKPNGYQSLHTVVFTPHGQFLEIQIRTQEMHDQSIFGAAAHFHYTESGKPDAGIPVSYEKLQWLTQLQKMNQETEDLDELLNFLKLDMFEHRIFVFTPQGDPIDLPEGATPVDFAYHIHTDLGHSTIGAKINGTFSRLDTPLTSGDVVEILRDKKRKSPSPKWFSFVKTHLAKTHIKEALTKFKKKLANTSRISP